MATSMSRVLQPGLIEVTRPRTGVQLWLASAKGVTLISYDEDYARLWLSRASDSEATFSPAC